MPLFFPPLLKEQQCQSWQRFTEQHPKACQNLTELQTIHFQQALALSDFILASAIQAPELVVELFTKGETTELPDYKNLLTGLLVNCQDEVNLHRQLRRFRLQQMVRIALDDLLFDADLEFSLLCLSSLADELILASLCWLTDFCQTKWGVPKNNQGETQQLLVYGMGKLGGKELNFSSDIDLIFTYPESGETVGCRRSIDNQQFFIRLAQKLIASLHQVTADGFVYRVDMRLRPFGESGPLVLTFDAMEDYYQEQGRDWERYAMLKARVIGDSPYHAQLSAMLRPFVYRRYIDFSVIDSLRQMKMMITQEVRRKQLINNIKLGSGGIREVEFIVQVFQLIRGGRVKELQQRRLLTVLPQLVLSGELSESSKQILKNAYLFLRRVENIIQALADKQTQTLPDTALDQARIVTVLKLDSWAEFLDLLAEQMNGVHEEFEKLIGLQSPNYQAADEHWVTLWHSRWGDDESITWLEKDEHNWPSENVWQVLKDFREDVAKRSLGNRGRQVLDKLVPLLLCRLQKSKKADVVLARVLAVFRQIVTRTAYLELLFENEGAFKQLIHLCQASSWVSDYIAKYPILLDELIDPKLLHNSPELSSYALELRERMLRTPEDDLEAQMEALRQFKQSQQLRIAAADISNILPVDKVSDHLTALAEAILAEVINLAWQQISERFGVPTSCLADNLKDKGFGVIAYGKTGGCELGYSSDLDLVFVHCSERNEQTSGCADASKVIAASQFYMKLAQRIMHIFNTRMNSGILYELDMRLRPSGNSGLLVVHLNTYAEYQEQDAWTWEHQALVRARMIYGNEELTTKFSHIRQDILFRTRKLAQLKTDVLNMRDKMRNHLDKSTEQQVDIKQGLGGLVDIEFLAQYLVLAHSSAQPAFMSSCDNLGIFKALAGGGVLTQAEQELLSNTYKKLRSLGHQAAMQNEALLMIKSDYIEQESIVALWQNFLFT